MEHEIQQLVAAAMEKQKALSAVVDDQMIAQADAMPDRQLDTSGDSASPAQMEATDQTHSAGRGTSSEVLSSVLPQHKVRQEQADELARWTLKLEASKQAHKKRVWRDSKLLEQLQATTAKASSVGEVLGQAKRLLTDCEQHMQLIEEEIPRARDNVNTARAAATEANVDLEKEMVKHHLSIESLGQISGHQEEADGHSQMLENIRQKRHDAKDKLDEVDKERNRLNKLVADATDLMNHAVEQQAAGQPTTLSMLKVEAARAHVADVKHQQQAMQQQLDQIQAEYRSAHDQLRDTELETVLFDARAAGTLTEGAMQTLQAKIKLAANADNVFAQTLKYERQIQQAQLKSKTQMEASVPLLKRTIGMLAQLKQQDQGNPN
jgi:hypothetical protein